MTGKNLSLEFIRFVSSFAPKIEPYETKDKDGRKIYIYDAKVIPLIAKYLGVRNYEIITPPDGQIGAKLPDGNWSGMIGMLLRGEADLAMSGVAVTLDRSSVVNYSYPYYYSTVGFMTDAPQQIPKYSAIFLPFSHTMWLALAGLTVAMSFVFYFLLDRRQPFQRVLFGTIGSMLEKAFAFKTTKPAYKMAGLAWTLGMFVLTNSYKAVLLSFLSFPTMIGIRDIPDLARVASSSASFKCFTFPGTYMVQELIDSGIPSWKSVGECLRRNEVPGNPLSNFVASPHGKAYVGTKVFTAPFERGYFVSQDDFFIEQYGIPFAQTFCCPKDLNRILHRLTAAGIFEKMLREENFILAQQTPSARKTTEYSGTSSVISLGDMSAVFCLLVSGWIVGFVVLIIEIFKKKCR